MKKITTLILTLIVVASSALAQDCQNWLSIPNTGKVTMGDIDVTGDQLTVEAVFNRSSPLNSGLYYGSLVSKHSTTNDINYSLLPNGCEISTVNGNRSTFQNCNIQTGRTYHVAMVYNGATLSFYRNGNLVSQTSCTGNMIVNNWQTTIGQLAFNTGSNNQFVGFINEIRIWNVARSSADLAAYMSGTLPSPTTQTGLLAYYRFDNLANKQGNTAFNGTASGNAATGATNPSCALTDDVCTIDINDPGCDSLCYWKLRGNSISNGNNILGTMSNHDIRIYTNGNQRGVLKSNGNFGWQTSNPTALFHINCANPASGVASNLRFENLQTGDGSPLLIDANGYVFVSNSAAREKQKMQEMIEELKAENENLKKRLTALEQSINKPGSNSSERSLTESTSADRVFQNKPNPTSDNTTIEYKVGKINSNALLVITDLNGRQLLSYRITKVGTGSIQVSSKQLNNGMYLYSLIVDGQEKDTKKMIISH